jgi:UDP-N-acetylglucosamine 2-epimerase
MMKPLSIAIVAGDRPNFMKIATIIRVLQAQSDTAPIADTVRLASGYVYR